MRHLIWLVAAALLAIPRPLEAQQAEPKVLISDLTWPQDVITAPDGKIYILDVGKPGSEQPAGAILVLEGGKAKPFYTGLGAMFQGLVAYQKWLFVLDAHSQSILKIDSAGKAKRFVRFDAFPTKVRVMNHLTVDQENGTLYASNWDPDDKKAGVIYRIPPNGKVSVVTNQEKWPEIGQPGPILLDGGSHLLVADLATDTLSRVNVATGKAEKIADNLPLCRGMTWDHHGQLFINGDNRVFGISRPGEKPVALPFNVKAPFGLCLDATGKQLLLAASSPKFGSILSLPAVIPGWEVDTTPLKFETELAFPKIKWAGWVPMTPAGKPNEFRPLLLTHAGDDSNRIYVGTQHGIVYVFPNKPEVEKAEIFLDISERVLYNPNENEQGFLGMAFHPGFKKNGELYIFYSHKKLKLTNYLSRFRVDKNNPSRIDPASEEILLEIKRPFWNHDGGTVLFGPDGYLYLTLGDGGLANDPFNNAQNLNQFLGHILRIDVNRQEAGKKYAIPNDNPFVGRKGVQPEIYAYGLRNVWRMAFDKKTGQLWAADVGQNLYEEINLIIKGGNYGWKLREGLHPFWSTGSGPRPDLIDPIWEYDHNIGKSITGGFVYRGKQFPELEGHYLYADYVSGKIWALRYDSTKKRVVANHPIKDRNLPIMSWGEDQNGEAYLMTYSNIGQGIYRLVRSK
jgi:glucose/arabinose dehydrogenase